MIARVVKPDPLNAYVSAMFSCGKPIIVSMIPIPDGRPMAKP